MGAPVSLLGQVRGFARDFPRDRMPPGYLWDSVDFVPTIMDATLTGRGGWDWGSDDLGADVQTGILATFLSGDQLLVQAGGNLMQVNPEAPYNTIANRGGAWGSLQNPVLLRDVVVQTLSNGSAPPQLWRSTGAPTNGTAAMKHPKFATVFKSMLVSGGSPGEEHVVRFSVPGKDLANADSYDDASNYLTSQKITALAALRSMILVFHPSTVERIRGSQPASSVAAQPGDMFVENLFDNAGCQEPKTIASWNDNIIFADEHGVHLTDGATIKNLVNQGGIQSFWRPLWQERLSACGTVFLDYYMITLRNQLPPPGPIVGTTLICDLNRRQWFRFNNINVLTLISSGGSTGVERVWGGRAGSNRLSRLGPCFFPTGSGTRIDADGTPVLPVFETAWYPLGEEGRKRARFAYLSYDVRVPPVTGLDDLPGTYDTREPIEIGPRAVVDEAVQVSYIRSPQDIAYTSMGHVPSTTTRTRFRLPLGQFPYGVAFQTKLTTSANVVRVFDLAVEAQPAERSRV